MSYEVGGRPPRALVLGTGVAGLLAVLLAVLLPLAPVQVNEPTVHWPVDPARPISTMLNVTSYRPLELDVLFSCRAVRAAAETDFSATVFSTVNPVLPEAADLGLIARVSTSPTGEQLTVDGVGSRLVREQLPPGDCVYRVHGDSTHGLTLERDGLTLGRGPAGVLPDTDVLVTSVSALPDAIPADLDATLRLDDEFASTPTGLKTGLTVLLVLALVAVAAGLWKLDRAVPRVPSAGRWFQRLPRPHPADAVVVAAMFIWLLLAPSTDDDGYYAAMATNSRFSGYVGNFYQLYDQGFTPITWFYRLLAWWQTVVGTAPVAQRMLALTAGLLTWCVARTLIATALRQADAVLENPVPVGATPGDHASGDHASGDASGDQGLHHDAGRLVRLLAPGVAAVVFLSWWLPQGMGVRPESVVGLLAALGLLGVSLAIRRRRLLAAFGACAAAGFALATHTTGFVGFAPLLAGLGGLCALVRVPGGSERTGREGTGSEGTGSERTGSEGTGRERAGWDRSGWNWSGWARTGWDRTLARAVAVVSGGMTAALAGFADGSLRDFLRAQQIFLDIQPREYWYTEYLRWFFLLGEGPMGNYAKRVAVLVALVGLVWFLALSAACRGRGEPVPASLRLAGWSLIASFGLLWLTPSKWTHHFGALAGIGSVFLTLLLVMALPLTRRVFSGTRLPLAVPLVAAGSVLVVLTLAGHGRNVWPYAWLFGFADVNVPPDVGPFAFSSPVCWVAVLAGCLAVGWGWTRTRDGAGSGNRVGAAMLRGVALFVIAGLALNIVYLLGSFGLSAHNTTGRTWTLWAADSIDPAATHCGAADAVDVYDPYTAVPLTAADTSSRSSRSATAGSGGSVGSGGSDPDSSGSGSSSSGSSESGGTQSPGTDGLGGSDAVGSGTAGSGDGAGESTDPDGDGSGRPALRRSRPGGPGAAETRARTATGDSTGFERSGGYYLGYQPPVQLGTGAATTIWGSLFSTEGRTPDRTTGEMRTRWYELPVGIAADQAVAVLVAGSLSQGNSLTAEYGSVSDGRRVIPIDPGVSPPSTAQHDPGQLNTGQLAPEHAHTTDLDDTARDPRWRSVLLTPPVGAQVVRLHAVDDSSGPGGWLAFAAPAVQRLTSLRTVLTAAAATRTPPTGSSTAGSPAARTPAARTPAARSSTAGSPAAGSPGGADPPVAIGWQIAFQYPCLRQSRIRDGITEPPTAAVLWADTPFAGTRDSIWLPFRGGIYGQVQRTQSALELTARIRGAPAERRLEVLVFDTSLAPDAYILTTRQRRTDGWERGAPTPTRTSNELERCVQTAAATGTSATRCVPKPTA